MFVFFFFQAEDGIRDAQESRELGDVYKRQVVARVMVVVLAVVAVVVVAVVVAVVRVVVAVVALSLIHI